MCIMQTYPPYCQALVPVQQNQKDKELTLFSPCHNKNNNKKKKNKNPHQNLPNLSVLKTWNLEHRLNLQYEDLTHNPQDGQPPSQGWSPNIPMLVTHHAQDGQVPIPEWSSTIPKTVTHQPRRVPHHSKDGHPSSIGWSTTIPRSVTTIQKEVFYGPRTK